MLSGKRPTVQRGWGHSEAEQAAHGVHEVLRGVKVANR